MTLIATPRPAQSEWTTHDLALIVRRVASQPHLWRPKIKFTAERYWARLPGPEGVDVWLLTWLPSQATDLHDHGDSAAAFAVVEGALTEVRADDVLGVWSTTLHAPAVRVVEPGIVHDVRNDLVKPAVSIHAYGPRLERCASTTSTSRGLAGRVPHRVVQRARAPGMSTAVATRPPGPPAALTIDQVLARARSQIRRVTPTQAAAEHVDGALLVDIRPAAQRLIEGEVPGALVIERNVLEWRLDPTSDARLPQAVGYDVRILVLCSEGYTSSLAAAALVELGLHRATDVEGGFLAWRTAGLPTTG